MQNVKELPIVGTIIQILDTYPRLSAWGVLSVGIVALLIYEARDVGLSAGNWIALIVASVVVAGLCIWIVSWEDDEEETASIRVSSEIKPVDAAILAAADPQDTDTSTAEETP